MHEHGLCDSLLALVRERFPQVPAGARLRVRLRASEISGLTAAALQQALDHAHECHQCPPCEVELRCDGLLGRCRPCGQVVEVTPELRCAQCGSQQVSLCGGGTLLVEELNLMPLQARAPAAQHG